MTVNKRSLDRFKQKTIQLTWKNLKNFKKFPKNDQHFHIERTKLSITYISHFFEDCMRYRGYIMTGFMNWFGEGLQTAGSIPYIGFKLLVILGIVWIIWTIWEHIA